MRGYILDARVLLCPFHYYVDILFSVRIIIYTFVEEDFFCENIDNRTP